MAKDIQQKKKLNFRELQNFSGKYARHNKQDGSLRGNERISNNKTRED